VTRLLAGASGWSYPSWRPGFYPGGTRPEEFLALYSALLPAVELNASGYRLPSAEQFARWAEQVPDGFAFAVKAPRLALRSPDTVRERVLALGDRLGCVRVVLEGARDDALLERLVTGFSGVPLALDPRDESWQGALGGTDAVAVGDRDEHAGWCYLRFRDPPYDGAALAGIADEIRPLLDRGNRVFGFFRHEDEPSAPLAALRLLDLIER